MSGDGQQRCVPEQSGSGATEHAGSGAIEHAAEEVGVHASEHLKVPIIEAAFKNGHWWSIPANNDVDSNADVGNSSGPSAAESPTTGSGELRGPCPRCVVDAPIGDVPLHMRRRIRLKFCSGNRLTVAGLLRNSDFGLLPGHWTVRKVLNTSHWIKILREGCNPAQALEDIDFERMPVDWRPCAVILGCCPGHSKGVPGLGEECLDSYGGCEAVAMGTPHDILCKEIPCNVDLDSVSTPPTPPPF